MKEQPKVKMSVDMGRAFMLQDPVWFDTDMRESSSKLCEPFKDSPVLEKMKFTLCQHAVNAYHKYQIAGESHDTILELLWFTYGFAPSQILLADKLYRALISPRGVCWLDQPPRDAVEPDGKTYFTMLGQTTRIRNNLIHLYRQEQQIR